jgi:hypothetical protein
MFLSKIQVKNLLIKELGKHAMSQSRRGRVCAYSSTGLKFDEKENGFTRVYYFDNNATYQNREASQIRKARETEKANSALMALGFEFDGIDGYRKERNTEGKRK